MTAFIDEVEIHAKAGDGGPGAVTFRREKYVPRGGPSGGNGGKGGDVIIAVDPHMNTLFKVAHIYHYKAADGRPGMSKDMTGRDGKDCIIPVPLGTIVKDLNTGAILRDLKHPDDSVIVALGGKGGWGNAHFATSTNQTPRNATDGKPGQEKKLQLELKLVADVGLVGLPNAGKSTLLSAISAAKPKIANYPFTTLNPNLGLVDLGDFRNIIVADIPGLIEGAHEGVGLGHQFLRHVERCKYLIHLVDLAPISGPTPEEAYKVIRNELEQYSPTLAAKPEILVGNKLDLTDADKNLKKLSKKLKKEVFGISAATRSNVDKLLLKVSQALSDWDKGGL